MLEIKGEFNTAICYASVIEEEAVEQIRRMCNYEFTKGSRIRIMPDVHAGKGCTIGTTMTVVDKAVPNIVGVDIGCGMYTVNLGKAAVDFEKLDELNREFSAIGNNLNQLTKYFNMGGLRSQAMTEELTRCINAIMDMRKEVKELGGEYRGYAQTHRK
jgi:RNA-splicing ligase RtcB